MTKSKAGNRTVTRDGIKKLESKRPILNCPVDYTIGGSVETSVHSCLNAEREGRITQGWKTLEGASQKLRRDQPNAALPGYAKAEFKERANGKAAYLERQKKAASAAVSRPRSRRRAPSHTN
ncbi:MAG: hypothetical protein AAGA63_09625 [Pseudomonadota bacterium]